MFGTVTKITDLSKTAKDITFSLPHDLPFIAGQFVNIFMDIEETKVRRAYSIASSDSVHNEVTLTLRHSPTGVMTPVIWKTDITGMKLEIVGPLGVNTADKLQGETIYLFGYGVGAGVTRSVLDHVIQHSNATKIVVMTGSRSEDEILHKEYFDTMSHIDSRVTVKYVVSNPSMHVYLHGYIQDHLDNFSFNNADVYMCGHEVACNSLREKIRSKNPKGCTFLVEAFH